MEPYTRKSSRMHDLFQSHMALLSRFLTSTDQNNLKLVCRSAYYNIITCSLWSDIKLQIVAQKHQYIEDDYELQTNDPQPKEQQEVKLIRNIRIHSLNKRNAGDSVKKSKQNNQSGIKLSGERFSSTFKTKITTSAKPVLNNIKFMKTEIGFKRMSTNSKTAITYQYLLELPDKLQLSMLEPHGKQSMQLVLKREQLIVDMISKWTDYQKKILEPMNAELIKQSQQTAYWKIRASMIKQYQGKFTSDKYQKVLQNINKIMILDENLKKKLQQFGSNANHITQYSNCIQQIRILYQDIETKTNQIKEMQGFKYWQQVEDILETYTIGFKLHTQFISKKALNFIQTVDELYETGIVPLGLSIQKLCINSEEMELLLEILVSISSKILYLLESSESKFKQSLLLAKYQKYKQISLNLSKMTKYFSKIKSQLKQKQKQKKGNDAKEIESFIKHYENYQTEYVIMDQKSFKRVQKEMFDFKKRIEVLKTAVKKEKETQ